MGSMGRYVFWGQTTFLSMISELRASWSAPISMMPFGSVPPTLFKKNFNAGLDWSERPIQLSFPISWAGILPRWSKVASFLDGIDDVPAVLEPLFGILFDSLVFDTI